MICLSCYKYDNTKTRWRRKGVFRNCGDDDRTSDKTNECSNESKYANCREGHMAGRNECEIGTKERVMKKMHADSRVGRRIAPQIITGEDESSRSNPQSYSTHLRYKMDPEKKSTREQ